MVRVVALRFSNSYALGGPGFDPTSFYFHSFFLSSFSDRDQIYVVFLNHG